MRMSAVLSIALFLTVPLLAQQHHAHGEAAVSGDVGVVAFSNSGAPAAQADFLRGLALLHNFEYRDAAESFRKAQAIDASFAMAYWGEAMTHTHPVWMQQDRDAARGILQRLGSDSAERAAKAKTARERAYLRAVEVLYGEGAKEERDFKYADEMAAVHAAYPDDVDAAALHALALLGTAHKGRDFAIYMRAAAILEEVFPKNTRHPGVLHYLIHCYDDPVHAPLGMRAARLYGSVAPNAPHALHMTSHIFIARGMWDEVIDANRRAVDVLSRSRVAQGRPPAVCGHYPLWLVYGYVQTGRFEEAKRVIGACRERALAEPPQAGERVPIDVDDSPFASFAGMRAFYINESGRDDLEPLPESAPVAARFTATYTDALAAARRGDIAALRSAAKLLHAEQQELLRAIESRKFNDPTYRLRTEVVRQQVDGLLLIAEGKGEEGIAMLRRAAETELSMPVPFGPPVVEKPSFELLGDALLKMSRYEEAKEAFRASLARTPGRAPSLQGLKRATGEARPDIANGKGGRKATVTLIRR